MWNKLLKLSLSWRSESELERVKSCDVAFSPPVVKPKSDTLFCRCRCLPTLCIMDVSGIFLGGGKVGSKLHLSQAFFSYKRGIFYRYQPLHIVLTKILKRFTGKGVVAMILLLFNMVAFERML